MKKFATFAVSAVMAVTGLCGSASPIINNDDAVYAESNYNYGEALQKLHGGMIRLKMTLLQEDGLMQEIISSLH